MASNVRFVDSLKVGAYQVKGTGTGGGGGGNITIQNNGNGLTTAATTLNFTTGITASGSGSTITIAKDSTILDFPQPFGPTTAQRFPGRVTVVASTKDLKPASLICFSLMQSDVPFLSLRQLNSSRYHTSHFCDRIALAKALSLAGSVSPRGFAYSAHRSRHSTGPVKLALIASASRLGQPQRYV